LFLAMFASKSDSNLSSLANIAVTADLTSGAWNCLLSETDIFVWSN
jgi:hypothetical protein